MPQLDHRELAAIFSGGFVGAIARSALTELLPSQPDRWPWVTFGVNLVGAFLLGYFITRLEERLPLSAYRRPFLGTGICGALTTFSTMQLELVKLIDNGQPTLAIAYGTASVLGGFAAVLLATNLVRRARLR
ncbi:MAG: fluoride efflux transporter CrcB [Solirubrobacteraceae bacterium]